MLPWVACTPLGEWSALARVAPLVCAFLDIAYARATLRPPLSPPFLPPPSKGIAGSALPYKRSPPSWLKTSAADVEDHVAKLAKKGLTPSQIGVILRDSHGIAQVKSVTGTKILRILKRQGE